MKQPNAYRLELKDNTFVFKKRDDAYPYLRNAYSCDDLDGELLREETLIKLKAVPVPDSKQIKKLDPYNYSRADMAEKLNELTEAVNELQKG